MTREGHGRARKRPGAERPAPQGQPGRPSSPSNLSSSDGNRSVSNLPDAATCSSLRDSTGADHGRILKLALALPGYSPDITALMPMAVPLFLNPGPVQAETRRA